MSEDFSLYNNYLQISQNLRKDNPGNYGTVIDTLLPFSLTLGMCEGKASILVKFGR